MRMRNDLLSTGESGAGAKTGAVRSRPRRRPREYGFGRISSIPHFPEPEKAVAFLERLANDNGIVKIMEKHRWKVGHLTELPPDGKVGISQVCLMGLNKNAGETILLRLRTDDMLGFRKYDFVRKVLLHELAHNEWGDHDDNFKALNSQLNREVVDLDWTRSKGRRLGSAVDLPRTRDEVVRQMLRPASPAPSSRADLKDESSKSDEETRQRADKDKGSDETLQTQRVAQPESQSPDSSTTTGLAPPAPVIESARPSPPPKRNA